MAWPRGVICIIGMWLGLVGPGSADIRAVAVTDDSACVEVALTIDGVATPWRAYTMDGPPRLIVEVERQKWAVDAPQIQSLAIQTVSHDQHDGWTRLIVPFSEPLAIDSAEGGADGIKVRLMPTTAEAFREAAEVEWPPIAPEAKSERPVIWLDPGHGGHDPGAITAEVEEADLMLTFALELRVALLATGRVDVRMSRDDDSFVPLDQRLADAVAGGADLFLSLHADQLADGTSSGLTVYILPEGVGESADAARVSAGVDLPGGETDIAAALLDLARDSTAPRARRLAHGLIEAFDEVGLEVHQTPLRQADLAVLKAAEVPSVLLELGFLSSESDRARLQDPDWRASATAAVRSAVMDWLDPLHAPG